MNNASRIALLSSLAAIAACGESATAPPNRPIQPAGATGGGSTDNLVPGDTLRFTITINPTTSQSYDLGNGHTVYFPQGSVCDPMKSTYGVGTWDDKCPKLPAPLVENVTAWIDSAGNPYEDFSPGIRFMPTTNPAKYVILSFTDPSASANLSMDILWCATTSSPCIDETSTDSTEATQHDPVSGKVWRRIKHFSGYNVAAGDESEFVSFNKVAPSTVAPSSPAHPTTASTPRPEGR